MRPYSRVIRWAIGRTYKKSWQIQDAVVQLLDCCEICKFMNGQETIVFLFKALWFPPGHGWFRPMVWRYWQLWPCFHVRQQLCHCFVNNIALLWLAQISLWRVHIHRWLSQSTTVCMLLLKSTQRSDLYTYYYKWSSLPNSIISWNIFFNSALHSFLKTHMTNSLLWSHYAPGNKRSR